MTLTFPRKNLAINDLIDFREAGTIYEFTDYLRRPEDEKGGWEKDNLQFKLDHIQRLFENMNEEINQTIHTSNDKTVNIFFEQLKSEIAHFNLLSVDKDYFVQISKQWNENKYNEFLEKVDIKEKEYFNQPERNQYAHLEKYTSSYYGFLTGKMENREIENKNFYCIEEKLNLIDLNFLDKYLEILERVTEKFSDNVSKEIELYDKNKLAGKIVEDSQSFYDKVVEKIKNNKVIAILLLIFALYAGVSEFIKLTRENKENIDSIENNGSRYEKPSSDLITLKIDEVSAVDYAPEPEAKNVTVTLKVIPKSNSKYVPIKSRGELILINSKGVSTSYDFDLNGVDDGIMPQAVSYIYLDGIIPKKLYEKILKDGNYKIKCVVYYDNDVLPGEQKFSSGIFNLEKESIKN
ncbi:hypothetical protein [Flavobacterium sp. Root420]|uniref:hypothetical protein n=1 Tax=Flavobacterium sp. Root420 TaxID=1736533 RepID=UPI0006F66B60|nr:hypothetical protein [Flavobacterium sp. Root420]KQX09885.1 hypothetical protein ASC72_21630 [Flavobacterium sp. Root420]